MELLFPFSIGRLLGLGYHLNKSTRLAYDSRPTFVKPKMPLSKHTGTIRVFFSRFRTFKVPTIPLLQVNYEAISEIFNLQIIILLAIIVGLSSYPPGYFQLSSKHVS